MLQRCNNSTAPVRYLIRFIVMRISMQRKTNTKKHFFIVFRFFRLNLCSRCGAACRSPDGIAIPSACLIERVPTLSISLRPSTDSPPAEACVIVRCVYICITHASTFVRCIIFFLHSHDVIASV